MPIGASMQLSLPYVLQSFWCICCGLSSHYSSAVADVDFDSCSADGDKLLWVYCLECVVMVWDSWLIGGVCLLSKLIIPVRKWLPVGLRSTASRCAVWHFHSSDTLVWSALLQQHGPHCTDRMLGLLLGPGTYSWHITVSDFVRATELFHVAVDRCPIYT